MQLPNRVAPLSPRPCRRALVTDANATLISLGYARKIPRLQSFFLCVPSRCHPDCTPSGESCVGDDRQIAADIFRRSL